MSIGGETIVGLKTVATADSTLQDVAVAWVAGPALELSSRLTVGCISSFSDAFSSWVVSKDLSYPVFS